MKSLAYHIFFILVFCILIPSLLPSQSSIPYVKDRFHSLWEDVHSTRLSQSLIQSYFVEKYHSTKPEMHQLIDLINEAEHYEILEVVEHESYSTAKISLKSPSWIAIRILYFVNDQNDWLIEYPWRILTQDWEELETDYFIFHYKPDKKADFGIPIPSDLHIDVLEKRAKYLENLFDISLDEKVHIYLANSHDEMQKLIYAPSRSEGIAIPTLYVIATIYPFSVAHELTHLFHVWFLIKKCDKVPYYDAEYRPDSMRFLAEGIAEHGDLHGGFQRDHLCHENVRRLLSENRLKPLNELLDGTGFGRQIQTTRNILLEYGYPEWSSFIGYLIDDFGNEKFRDFVQQAYDSFNIPNALQKTYGHSLENLQALWLNWVESDAPSDIDPEQTIYFRVITTSWQSIEIDSIKIHYDTEQRKPDSKSLRKWVSRMSNPKSIKKVFLANSESRMREIGLRDMEFYRNGEVVVCIRLE